MRLRSHSPAVASLFLVVAGCDARLDSLGPGLSNRDRTPPTVVSTVPANLASQVGTTSPISITFSEAMLASSLSGTAVSFTPSIAGVLSYAGNTATFTPSAALASGTQYVGTITTAVEDLAGNNLVAPFTWTFTTGTAALRVAR